MAFQMKGSPAKRGDIQGASEHASALKRAKALQYAWKGLKYIASKITGKSTKVKSKVPKKNKIKVDNKKGTVTEITPTGSEITRTSWPNVKPGEISSFPGTTTLPDGRVIAFDATKTQILKP